MSEVGQKEVVAEAAVSRRDWIAAHIAAGLAANSHRYYTPLSLADEAVKCADALVEELDR